MLHLLSNFDQGHFHKVAVEILNLIVRFLALGLGRQIGIFFLVFFLNVNNRLCSVVFIIFLQKCLAHVEVTIESFIDETQDVQTHIIILFCQLLHSCFWLVTVIYIIDSMLFRFFEFVRDKYWGSLRLKICLLTLQSLLLALYLYSLNNIFTILNSSHIFMLSSWLHSWKILVTPLTLLSCLFKNIIKELLCLLDN